MTAVIPMEKVLFRELCHFITYGILHPRQITIVILLIKLLVFCSSIRRKIKYGKRYLRTCVQTVG